MNNSDRISNMKIQHVRQLLRQYGLMTTAGPGGDRVKLEAAVDTRIIPQDELFMPYKAWNINT